jgi:predicted dehydrogenase
MKEPVKWGVLSTANIGVAKVLPAMMQSEALQVVAIASRDGARAAEAAGSLGIPRSHDSYEALLADPEVEAIYNPLPNHLHVPWTVKALEAGKHVLCEKPVALSAAEAGALVEARDRTGLQVAEAFMVREHPQWQRARELAVAGELGDVRLMNVIFSYHLTDPGNVRNQADIGGGALYDVGCYAIATARYIFGAEPERVVALIDRDPDMGTDRLTSGLVDFGAGRHLVFTAGTQASPCQKAVVLGSTRSLEFDVPFNPDPARPARILLDDGGRLGGRDPETESFAPVDHYRLQAESFGAAIRGQSRLPFAIEDAVANMKVIDALFRSADTRGWEAV